MKVYKDSILKTNNMTIIGRGATPKAYYFCVIFGQILVTSCDFTLESWICKGYPPKQITLAKAFKSNKPRGTKKILDAFPVYVSQSCFLDLFGMWNFVEQ